MVDLGLLLHGFGTVLSGYNLIALVLGSFFGIIIGAIPGLTATMGIAILVPFTFGMTPITGIVMLLGIYTGAIYGGGIASILIKTPGTPAAAATVFDGYPMAQQGLAGKAIGIATISSGIGGTFTALCLAFFAPILATFALRFSAPEYFALAVLRPVGHDHAVGPVTGQGGHLGLAGPAPGDGRPGPDGRVPAVHLRLRRADRRPLLRADAHRPVRPVRGLPPGGGHPHGAPGQRGPQEHPPDAQGPEGSACRRTCGPAPSA